ncbi:MAG: histidine kinase [Bacteroidota bacterium]|nr:histidine kinase [Bacteroidota bacterium]
MEETVEKQPVHGKEKAAGRLIKRVLLFCLPFWLVAALYIIDDPYRVLRDYHTYDSKLLLNEEYVGWHIYLNNKDSIHFNSFILGNSCTMAFCCSEWEKYLNGGRAVRLFGNAESMMAIYKKLLALEREHADLKNVLMILDKTSLAKTCLLTGSGHILPPDISGQNPVSAQLEFLQTFISPDILFPYLTYKLTGKINSSSKSFNPYGRIRNQINNDAINPREKMIKEEGEQYWITRKKEFPERSGKKTVAEPVIFKAQKALLLNIAGLLRKHSTSVKIVIGPDYQQESLHPQDVMMLKSIFGEQNVFDFTGINEYTANYHYFYEKGHYRPLLGDKILKRIYSRHPEDGH